MDFKHRMPYIYRELELNFAIYFHDPCSDTIFSFFVELFGMEVMMATKDGPTGEREDSGVEVRVIGDPIVSIDFT